jgi:hypothetical protein
MSDRPKKTCTSVPSVGGHIEASQLICFGHTIHGKEPQNPGQSQRLNE